MTALLGAPKDEDPAGPEAGSAYLFDMSPREEVVAPDVTGDGNPATDPNGDGLYEDVDGDGEFDIIDVATFLFTYDSEPVQDSAPLFDFTGDGVVDSFDVTALLFEL